MLANMATSLIIHKKIKTTVAKAKALRTYVEPLITKSKEDSTHSRRVVFSYLQNKDAVSELYREISPKIMERPGGYTRILKTGNRVGDNAEMCIIELVDYNENLLAAKSESAVKTGKRRRRGGGKKKEEPVTQASTAPKEKAETTAPPKEEADAQIQNNEAETQEPEAKVESLESTDKAEIQEPEKKEKADEPSQENPPEKEPEVKEEKKQDDVTDEDKKE
jgi:large subunit ribosomal protein L17